MQLINDWKRVLRHATSIRWMVVVVVLGLGDLTTYVFEPPQSIRLRAFVALLVAVSGGLGIFARLQFQRSLSDEDKQ